MVCIHSSNTALSPPRLTCTTSMPSTRLAILPTSVTASSGMISTSKAAGGGSPSASAPLEEGGWRRGVMGVGAGHSAAYLRVPVTPSGAKPPLPPPSCFPPPSHLSHTRTHSPLPQLRVIPVDLHLSAVVSLTHVSRGRPLLCERSARDRREPFSVFGAQTRPAWDSLPRSVSPLLAL